jgi:hypothetical protein
MKNIFLLIIGIPIGFGLAHLIYLFLTIRQNIFGEIGMSESINYYIDQGELPSSFRHNPKLNGSIISIIGLLLFTFSFLPELKNFLFLGIGIAMFIGGLMKFVKNIN